MVLQNINEKFLEFIQEQDINVPEDFIYMFYASISLDQWISNEIAQEYLEYTYKNNFNKALSKFVIGQDYKEITKEEYDLVCYSTINGKKQGGQNKKYYLFSPDCFKIMLLMRDSEKGKQYCNQYTTIKVSFQRNE